MAPSITADIESNFPVVDPVSKSKLSLIRESRLLLRTPLDSVPNLSRLLARASTTTSGLTFGTSGNEQFVSYSELLDDAVDKARLLGHINGLSPLSVVLLHFDSQRETIQWFWATTIAGYLPAISTPFVHDATQRRKHLHHLHALLRQPVILTTGKLMPEFLGVEELSLHDVDKLSVFASSGSAVCSANLMTGNEKKDEDMAVLMLTSGSTNSAKAVPLRHGQILKAVLGKSAHHGTEPGDVFLNWVGMDHVASLTEIHLHASMLQSFCAKQTLIIIAVSLGSDQVHVPASDLLRDPLQFVHLLDRHKVSYTFAPNFFLTKVRDSLVASPGVKADLSHLKALISGGESNVVTTCEALTHELHRFNTRGEVIRPGFGMTETCAGSIYSCACPSFDLMRGLEFANLGTCIPGMEMRVMRTAAGDKQATPGEVGDLQVAGPVVFDHYFNNPVATADAFTADGWFVTGDLAWIDESGSLNLAGRSKDTIIVNGVKWSSTEIETAIEEEGILGLVTSFTIVFPHRAPGSSTEDIAVVYSPAYKAEDHQTRFETATAIAKTVALMTGSNPAFIIPLPQEMLEKSSLGKISRTKVRAAFDKGEYTTFQKVDAEAIKQYRESEWCQAETPTEKIIQSALSDLLEIPAEDISMHASIFDLGITSFNLILLKSIIEKALDSNIDIPMSMLLTEYVLISFAFN